MSLAADFRPFFFPFYFIFSFVASRSKPYSTFSPATTPLVPVCGARGGAVCYKHLLFGFSVSPRHPGHGQHRDTYRFDSSPPPPSFFFCATVVAMWGFCFQVSGGTTPASLFWGSIARPHARTCPVHSSVRSLIFFLHSNMYSRFYCRITEIRRILEFFDKRARRGV